MLLSLNIGFKPVDTAKHHQLNIVPLLKEAFDEAKVFLSTIHFKLK